MMHSDADTFKEVEQLLQQGMSIAQIREHLVNSGLSADDLERKLSIVRSLTFKKQRQWGFTCIALGALLCLSSCLLTLFHDYSASYVAFTLYGMTMLGACLVLAGLALIFGF